MKERTHLPDRLYSGDVVQSKTGHQMVIVETSERDHFDQPLYKLRHPMGFTGHLLHSRDQMDADEVTLVKRAGGQDCSSPPTPASEPKPMTAGRTDTKS